MKRFLAITLLVLLFLLAGCGAVAEEVPLVPIDPNPDAVDVVTPTPDTENKTPEGGEDASPLPVHVHEFAEATCAQPKTCACGEMEGEAKGHSWNDATCTQPMTCNDCGATEGAVKDHQWNDATCTQPKTCNDCGKTEGAVANHNYQNGKCTTCGDENQTPSVENMVWIPKSGKKYHAKATCSNMVNPTEVTKEDAIARNYTPCKKCYG